MAELVTYKLVETAYEDGYTEKEMVPYPSYQRFALQAGRIVHYESVGTYQGSHVFGLKNQHGTPGLLIMSFGSCSYCDALQAARDSDDPVRDVTALRDQTVANVLWGKRAIKKRDWRWHIYDREMVRAINMTLAALNVDFQVEVDDDRCWP